MPSVLLCHFDGSSGSTTFTDDAGHTLTATGATVNTAAPKFGTGAGDFTSGSGANINTGSSADFNIGAGPFTVEAWAYFTSAPSGSGVYGVVTQFGGSSNYGWFFGMLTGQLNLTYSFDGSSNPGLSAAFSPTLNTWYHIAVDRDSLDVVRIYLSGAVVASATIAGAFFNSTRNCIIGNDENLTRAFPGRLDEVRVTLGRAQYGGAFTPPTGAFSMPSFPTAHGATTLIGV